MGKPRNVIVLVADSLRFDSVYGKDGTKLPYIDQNGTAFTGARSSGCWTLPATASLFTGMMPHEHGATSQTRAIHKDIPTLAEQLKAEGYKTYQITANIATTDIFGLHRGFDEVRKIWQLVPTQFNKLQQFLVLIGKPRLRNMLLSKDAVMHKISEDLRTAMTWLQLTHVDIFNEAKKILKENEEKGEKTFLFLNLMESHFPYHVAPTFETSAEGPFNKIREVVALFHTVNQSFLKTGKLHIKRDMLNVVRERQRQSWEIMAPNIDQFAREMHEDKDNLMVFCSDHGDNFGDQGWMYHFSNVTDGGNRVPIFWLSHDHECQDEISANINSKDLYKTIIQAVKGTKDPSLLSDPELSPSVLQSFWYNNRDQTLPEFRYNQFCFIEGNIRYMNRRKQWYSAPIALGGMEPVFSPLDRGVDPIQEAISDSSKKRYIEEAFRNFRIFSQKVGEVE